MERKVSKAVLLRQVNRLRVALNNEPLPEIRKGVRSNPAWCPIACSLKNGVEVYASEEEIEFNFVKHPLYVKANNAFVKVGNGGIKEQLAFTAAHDAWFEFASSVLRSLRQAGFEVYDDRNFLDPEFGKLLVKRLCSLAIVTTKTMADFMYQFDEGKFEEFVVGRMKAKAQLKKAA